MRERILKSFEESAAAKRAVLESQSGNIERAAAWITETLRSGGKLLFCGNGGSASDSQHLAAEFVGRYEKERRGLAAVALTTDTSILTAVGNDYSFERIFSRQVEALGRPGDLLFGLSTSGNSPNVVAAVRKARELGLRTVVLSGRDGGQLAREAELSIIVPAQKTSRIQECHILIGHVLCELADEAF
ncbi:MAG: Phosphoheptose isomerase 1 [Candidatus Omnitrophica bacterium]|nr:Phosphoheptose isomerase 1 [Candidatus Omnitrophota bacterium]